MAARASFAARRAHSTRKNTRRAASRSRRPDPAHFLISARPSPVVPLQNCLSLTCCRVQVDKLPIWNFDGSSTEQAPGDDSEVLLRPCAFYSDPFRPNHDNILVLCDCYKPDPDGPKGLGEPIKNNTRVYADKIMTKVYPEPTQNAGGHLSPTPPHPLYRCAEPS